MFLALPNGMRVLKSPLKPVLRLRPRPTANGIAPKPAPEHEDATPEHEGATEDDISDRTGPGAGYDQEPQQKDDGD